MQRPTVVVSDSVFPNLDPARSVLSNFGAELRVVSRPTGEEILDVARNADAVMVTYAKLTAGMISQLNRCRIIVRFGIGVDNVDLRAATQAGIAVCNVPDYCIDEVSDHTIALLLALVRKIPFSNAHVHAGRWDMSLSAPIYRLRGKILGLVGFGKIPQMVAPKAMAFGLKVITYDPFIPQETLDRLFVKRTDFSELVRTSDYVSIHCPLVPTTEHLFRADIFRQMKRSSYLVNTARGPIVDDNALASALDSGQLAGAALDVLPQEPPSGSPLFGRSNVILTPHMSFYSVESLEELQTKAAEEVVRVLSGLGPRSLVNPEVLRASQKRTATAEPSH